MRYLIEVTENYRADTEAEAAALIEEAKHNNMYTLKRYTSVHKERTQKGELIDEWYKVTLVKTITSEKEPDSEVSIEYKE